MTVPRAPVGSRVAAAPISWGVCEVPGWGYQLSADRVLTQMRSLGLVATEFGPDGFLAAEPAMRADQLRSSGMRAIGGFLPVVLHDPSYDPRVLADRFIDACLVVGASSMVLGASTGEQGYGERRQLSSAGWATLLANLDRLALHARDRGVQASLHPHVGTMVERRSDVDRVLAESSMGLCLDTGHLLIGGTDPLLLAQTFAERVVHVHLKDVDAAMAARVRHGEITFDDAVRHGLFKPLGQGDIDIAALVGSLEGQGYNGWYVLEQDVMLDTEHHDGPVAQVRESLDFLLGAAA